MRLFFVCVFTVLLIRNFCVSEFHQDDYEIVHDRIDIVEINKTAAPTLQLKVYNYNNTLKVKVVNLTVDLKPGIRKNLLLTFGVFKSVQKNYRQFPLPTLIFDVCEEFKKLGDKNPFGVQAAIAASNFKGCPASPGVYYVNSWLVEDDKFPPHAPLGDYKLTIRAVVDDDIFVLDAAWYGKIIRKKKS